MMKWTEYATVRIVNGRTSAVMRDADYDTCIRSVMYNMKDDLEIGEEDDECVNDCFSIEYFISEIGEKDVCEKCYVDLPKMYNCNRCEFCRDNDI
jgi:hypothetical protein